MSEPHEKPGFRTETKRLIRAASDWLEELGEPPSKGALEKIPEVDARKVALHANAVLAAHPESAIDPEQAVELVGFLVDLALFLLYVQDATEDANELRQPMRIDNATIDFDLDDGITITATMRNFVNIYIQEELA